MKSRVLTFALVIVLCFFLRILNEEKVTAGSIIYLFLILFAGTGLSGREFLMLPAMTLAMFVVFIILRRSLKDFLKLLIAVIFAFAFMAYKYYLIWFGISHPAPVHVSNEFYLSMEGYFGTIMFLIIMIIAAVLILPRRGRNHIEGFSGRNRLFVFISLAVTVILFVNRFVMPYVRSVVLGGEDYSLIFRLLQPSVITALGLAEIGTLPKFKPLRALLDILCCVCPLMVAAYIS